MRTENGSRRISRARAAQIYAIYLSILAVLCVASAEVILRAKGLGPYRAGDVSTQVEPGGKFFRPHPTLGYTLIPGRFRVTLERGFSFDVTHGPDTLRVTSPIDRQRRPRDREIWIFGCSVTHGWSLNDHETYPWLLQERFPEYDVVNFGVSGYGTIQSLLQLRSALERKRPAVAVLVYGGFHDERNTFSRSRRKHVATFNRLGPLVQPYARLGAEGQLRYEFADVAYPVLPIMRYSALAHYLEIQYNQLESSWHRSHEVSQALVKEMARLAATHGVTFVVAGFEDSESMLEFAEANGISNVDISLDLSLPGYTNMPYDAHPSAKANLKYADKLEKFLRELDDDSAEAVSRSTSSVRTPHQAHLWRQLVD